MDLTELKILRRGGKEKEEEKIPKLVERKKS